MIAASGSDAGENIDWISNKDGKLHLFGSGDMYDFTIQETNNVPWKECLPQIATVYIGDGISSVGTNAFYGCENLYSVTMHGSVDHVGYNAFPVSDSLEVIYFRTVEQWDSVIKDADLYQSCDVVRVEEKPGDYNLYSYGNSEADDMINQ